MPNPQAIRDQLMASIHSITETTYLFHTYFNNLTHLKLLFDDLRWRINPQLLEENIACWFIDLSIMILTHWTKLLPQPSGIAYELRKIFGINYKGDKSITVYLVLQFQQFAEIRKHRPLIQRNSRDSRNPKINLCHRLAFAILVNRRK